MPPRCPRGVATSGREGTRVRAQMPRTVSTLGCGRAQPWNAPAKQSTIACHGTPAVLQARISGSTERTSALSDRIPRAIGASHAIRLSSAIEGSCSWLLSIHERVACRRRGRGHLNAIERAVRRSDQFNLDDPVHRERAAMLAECFGQPPERVCTNASWCSNRTPRLRLMN